MLTYLTDGETGGTDAILRYCSRCLLWLSADDDFLPNEHLCKMCRPAGGNTSLINVRDAGIHGRARGITITEKGKLALRLMEIERGA